MPNIFRKKNKYGVTGRDGSQTRGVVRPLSATFTNNIKHLDEDEALNKKSRGRERTKQKQTRATSVPPRPVTLPFPPQGHSSANPKRGPSPDITPLRKQSVASIGRNNNISDIYATPGSHNVRNNIGNSSYQDFNQRALATWSGEVAMETTTASSEEDLTKYETPFTRDPSIRLETNSYHTQRKLSSFHSQVDDVTLHDVISPQNANSTYAQPYASVYSQNSTFSQASSFNPGANSSGVHQRQSSTPNDTSIKKAPPPAPRRSSSMFFEEVAVPTRIETYHHSIQTLERNAHKNTADNSEPMFSLRNPEVITPSSGKHVENNNVTHLPPKSPTKTHTTFMVGSDVFQNQNNWDGMAIHCKENAVRNYDDSNTTGSGQNESKVASSDTDTLDDDFDDDWSECETPRDYTANLNQVPNHVTNRTNHFAANTEEKSPHISPRQGNHVLPNKYEEQPERPKLNQNVLSHLPNDSEDKTEESYKSHQNAVSHENESGVNSMKSNIKPALPATKPHTAVKPPIPSHKPGGITSKPPQMSVNSPESHQRGIILAKKAVDFTTADFKHRENQHGHNDSPTENNTESHNRPIHDRHNTTVNHNNHANEHNVPSRSVHFSDVNHDQNQTVSDPTNDEVQTGMIETEPRKVPSDNSESDLDSDLDDNFDFVQGLMSKPSTKTRDVTEAINDVTPQFEFTDDKFKDVVIVDRLVESKIKAIQSKIDENEQSKVKSNHDGQIKSEDTSQKNVGSQQKTDKLSEDQVDSRVGNSEPKCHLESQKAYTAADPNVNEIETKHDSHKVSESQSNVQHVKSSPREVNEKECDWSRSNEEKEILITDAPVNQVPKSDDSSNTGKGSNMFVSSRIRSLNAHALKQDSEPAQMTILRKGSPALSSIENNNPQAGSVKRMFYSPAVKRRSYNFESLTSDEPTQTTSLKSSSAESFDMRSKSDEKSGFVANKVMNFNSTRTKDTADVINSDKLVLDSKENLNGVIPNTTSPNVKNTTTPILKSTSDTSVHSTVGNSEPIPSRPLVPSKPIQLTSLRPSSTPLARSTNQSELSTDNKPGRRLSGLLTPKPFTLDTSKLITKSVFKQNSTNSNAVNQNGPESNGKHAAFGTKPLAPVKPFIPTKIGTRPKSVDLSLNKVSVANTEGKPVVVPKILEPEKVPRQLPTTPSTTQVVSSTVSVPKQSTSTHSSVSFLDSLKNSSSKNSAKTAPNTTVPMKVTNTSVTKPRMNTSESTKITLERNTTDVTSFLEGLKRKDSVKKSDKSDINKTETVHTRFEKKTVTNFTVTDNTFKKEVAQETSQVTELNNSNNSKKENSVLIKTPHEENSVSISESLSNDNKEEAELNSSNDSSRLSTGGKVERTFSGLRSIDKLTTKSGALAHLKSPRQRRHYRQRAHSESDHEGHQLSSPRDEGDLDNAPNDLGIAQGRLSLPKDTGSDWFNKDVNGCENHDSNSSSAEVSPRIGIDHVGETEFSSTDLNSEPVASNEIVLNSNASLQIKQELTNADVSNNGFVASDMMNKHSSETSNSNQISPRDQGNNEGISTNTGNPDSALNHSGHIPLISALKTEVSVDTPTPPPRKSRRKRESTGVTQTLHIGVIPSDEHSLEKVDGSKDIASPKPYVSKMWAPKLSSSETVATKPIARNLEPKTIESQPQQNETLVGAKNEIKAEANASNQLQNEVQEKTFEGENEILGPSVTPPQFYQDDITSTTSEFGSEKSIPSEPETDVNDVTDSKPEVNTDDVTTGEFLGFIPPPQFDSPSSSKCDLSMASTSEIKLEEAIDKTSKGAKNLNLFQHSESLEVDDTELAAITANMGHGGGDNKGNFENETETMEKPLEPSPDMELSEMGFRRVGHVERSRPHRTSPVHKGRANKYDFVSSPEYMSPEYIRPEIVPRLDLSSVIAPDNCEFEERAIDAPLEGAEDAYSERGIDVPNRTVLHKPHNKTNKISITKVPRKSPKSPNQLASRALIQSPPGKHFSPRGRGFAGPGSRSSRSASDQSSSHDSRSNKSDQSKGRNINQSELVNKMPEKSDDRNNLIVHKAHGASHNIHTSKDNKNANSEETKRKVSNSSKTSGSEKSAKASEIVLGSPKSTNSQYSQNNFDVTRPQDIQIDFTANENLAEMHLPGFKMAPTPGFRPNISGGLAGPLIGSEHLHPALERSLRSPIIHRPRNGVSMDMASSDLGLNPGPISNKRASVPEMQVMVEDDYMTPRQPVRPRHHDVTKSIPEPWALSMNHSWGPAAINAQAELSRQDSMLSHVTDVSDVTTRAYPWQHKTLDRWDADDVIDWMECRHLDTLSACYGSLRPNGADLMQLDEHKLVNLGIADQMTRARILDELMTVKQHMKSPMSALQQQASMRRHTLEASSDALTHQLHDLTHLNHNNGRQINSYLEEMREQQLEAERLLNAPDTLATNPDSLATDSYSLATDPNVLAAKLGALGTAHEDDNYHNGAAVHRQSSDVSAFLPALSVTESEITLPSLPAKPLLQWNNNDVLQWLAMTDLGRFSNNFYTHEVTGKDLVEISMEFFDRINIPSLEDRELFLAKLYELQCPDEPLLEDGFNQSEKASTHNQSASSKQSHDSQSQSRSDRSRVLSTTSSSNKRVKQSPVSAAKRRAAMETRESPWTPGTIRKTGILSDEEREQVSKTVLLWHQLGGTMTSSRVDIALSSTCDDVIRKLLTQQKVSDDANLFYVVDRDANGREVEITRTQGMADLQGLWVVPAAHKLELRQRSGVQIKVSFKPAGSDVITKSMRVSGSSPCSVILHVACAKFGVQPNHHVLMQLYLDTGEVRPMREETCVSEMLTDCCLLVPKDSGNQATDIAFSLKRKDSMNSQHSSQLSDTGSQISMTYEKDDFLHELESQNNKYRYQHNTETKAFAEVEAEILDDHLQVAMETPIVPVTMPPKSSLATAKPPVPRQRAFTPVKKSSDQPTPVRRPMSAAGRSDTTVTAQQHNLELLQEMALLKESVAERDNALQSLRLQNEDLLLKADQLDAMHRKVVELESRLANKDSELQHSLHTLQQELNDLRNKQGGEVPHIKSQIDALQNEITSGERHCAKVRARLEHTASRSRPDVQLVEELQRELNQSEVRLKLCRERHSDLVQRLQEAEVMTSQPVVDIYDLILGDAATRLYALELAPKSGNYGLMIGRDRERRLVVRHTEHGANILKGDRLLEVNGRLVAKMEDQEIASFLKNAKQDGGSLRLVVLRDKEQANSPGDQQRMRSQYETLREDYQVMLMDAEAAECDKQELRHELEGVKQIVQALKRENEDLKHKAQEAAFVKLSEASPHTRLQLMLEHLQQPGNNSPLQRGASRRGLDWFHTIVSGEGLDRVLAYDEYDEKIPLYESMKLAPKEEVLQALKDTILETRQQKAYLDKLLATVIDNAPDLLHTVDRHLGIEDDLLSIKSKTEERC